MLQEKKIYVYFDNNVDKRIKVQAETPKEVIEKLIPYLMDCLEELK